jgi:hypothetical protein
MAFKQHIHTLTKLILTLLVLLLGVCRMPVQLSRSPSTIFRQQCKR